ncbi:MAG: hypothetical protein ACQESG_05815 [Nanobdellota archaeon]
MKLKKRSVKGALHWVVLKASIAVLVIAILVAAFYRSPYEIIDITGSNGSVEILMRSHGSMDLRDCVLELGDAVLAYSPGPAEYGEQGYFTRDVVTLKKVDPIVVNLSQPVSTSPHAFEGGFVHVCSENNCPRPYDGSFLAVRYDGSISYVPLQNEDGTVADLSIPSQRLNVDHELSMDQRLSMSAHGMTGPIPYVLGLNEEKLLIHPQGQLVDDLDGDGIFDYAWKEDELVIYLTKSHKTYHFTPGPMVVDDKIIGYYNGSIRPELSGTGYFTVEPISGSLPVLDSLDVVVLHAEGDESVVRLKCS